MQTGTTFIFRLFSAIAAFLLWGAWAYYANESSGKSAQLIAAGVQGSASLIITFIMVWAVTGFIAILPDSKFLYFLPAFFTVAITGSCLTFIHYLARTESIFATISAPLVVALIYCLYTNHKIKQANRANG